MMYMYIYPYNLLVNILIEYNVVSLELCTCQLIAPHIQYRIRSGASGDF